MGRRWPTVRDRAFEQRSDLDEVGRQGFAEVRGTFPRTWRKAKGTFQVSGDTSQYNDCDSGIAGWTAKRVG